MKIYAALPAEIRALWWTLFGPGQGSDPFAGPGPKSSARSLRRLRGRARAEPVGRLRWRAALRARRRGTPRCARARRFDRIRHELIPWPYTWDTARIRGLTPRSPR